MTMLWAVISYSDKAIWFLSSIQCVRGPAGLDGFGVNNSGVCSHNGEVIQGGCGCQKPIGRILMREVDEPAQECHLKVDGCLLERKFTENIANWFCGIHSERNTTFFSQQKNFPDTYWRKPEIIIFANQFLCNVCGKLLRLGIVSCIFVSCLICNFNYKFHSHWPWSTYFIKDLDWWHSGVFDRMLVTQAQLESLGLISNGEQLGLYEVDFLWQ